MFICVTLMFVFSGCTTGRAMLAPSVPLHSADSTSTTSAARESQLPSEPAVAAAAATAATGTAPASTSTSTRESAPRDTASPSTVPADFDVALVSTTVSGQQPERWIDRRREDGDGGDEASRSRRDDGSGVSPPLALLNGEPVTEGDLVDPLLEAAGGIVMEELLLNHMLRDRAAELGIEISAGDVERERRLLLEALDPDNRQQAARLLNEVRRRRGLGDFRYARLLERNALARAIVTEESADLVEVTNSMVEQEYARRYGPRYRVRLITAPGAAAAQRALDRVSAGEAFADVAVDVSTDAKIPKITGLNF
ncbi:MAG: hypothetical protein ACOC0P_00515, partial [Planctomycetota bacterium]